MTVLNLLLYDILGAGSTVGMHKELGGWQRQDTAICTRLLDQYRPIPAQAESLANWPDEDGRRGGQHFEQAVAVKTNVL